MKTIYKHTLTEPDDFQEAILPADAKFLTAREQKDKVCIWYETDTDTHQGNQATYEFAIYGTGHDIGRRWSRDREQVYLGTCSLHDGALIFHVYHLKPKTYWEETHDQ